MSTSDILPEGRYYTAADYFSARYDALSRQMAYRARTAEEHARWQGELRARLRELIGLDTMIPCPLAPRITERVPLDGYIRERVLLQTEPGVTMTLYVLIPADLKPGERRPAAIAPHGHGLGGKLGVAGRSETPGLPERIARYNGDYGLQFVRHGLIVFCPDARGFGERREEPLQGEDKAFNCSCEVLNHMALPLGQTVTGMWTWDLMRLTDYIQTRPECDGARIGSAGLSAGAWQTLWLAALDERIRCAVVSGYFFGYKESLLAMPYHCSAHFVPGLWLLADAGDIGALVAPRALMIESGDQDPLMGASGMANVASQVEIARAAYRLLGAKDRLAHSVFPGKHQWHGGEAIPWMERWLI